MEPGRSSGPSAGRCRLSGPLSHQCEKPRVTPKGRALRCGPPRPPHGPHPSRHVVTPCGVRLSCRPRRRHPCPLWGSQMQPRVWAEWSERGLHRSSGLAHSQGRLPRRRQRVGHSFDEDGPRQATQEPRVRWEAGSEQRPLLRVPWKERADGASRLRAVWAECRPARAQGPCCLVRPRVIRVGTVAWKAQFWAVVYSL